MRARPPFGTTRVERIPLSVLRARTNVLQDSGFHSLDVRGGWTPPEVALGFALAREEVDVVAVGAHSVARTGGIRAHVLRERFGGPELDGEVVFTPRRSAPSMILAIVQARCNSTRLPDKVLAPVLGRPMLALQLERLQRAESLDAVLVATSVEPVDEAVAVLCAELEVDCFRGSHRDVLDRYHRAAFARGASHVVRLPGDCPLCDPEVVDRVVDLHLDGEFDYTTNAPPSGRTFPDGLDVEVMRASVLAVAWREAQTPFDREHVTPFLRNRPERFHLGSVRDEVDRSQYRWTVDELADLALVRDVYEALYPRNPAFTTQDVLELLEAHPEIARRNAHVTARGCAR